MRIIVALIASIVLCTATPLKAEMKPEGMLETANAECINLGGEALAIQAIRFEINSITVDELVQGLDTLIKQEFPEGSKHQPLYLSRVRAVAKWVFYHYPPDFDENIVGQTYTIECQQKTFKQIVEKFPKIYGEGSKRNQVQKAWESAKDTEIQW